MTRTATSDAVGDRVPAFRREFVAGSGAMTRIGEGGLGGKAEGLASIRELIAGLGSHAVPEVEVAIPTLTVLTTDVFEAFMERNGLWELPVEELPDERIAHAFVRADLPAERLGDLRALAGATRSPLAVRSSSLLEDALGRPLAGVYLTKMTPNNQPDVDLRFRKLTEAIRLVYASTFLRAARSYRAMLPPGAPAERMAVILQEVVGRRHGDRFYPDVSGVARSINVYPTGHGRPEDGVVSLALGLGKTIVDGGEVWSYSPPYPKAPPPFNSPGDLVKHTQNRFWAVNMGKPPAYDALRETEYLVHAELADAEADDTLRFVASTFDVATNRITAGAGARGPRVVNFAPLLVYNQAPLNAAVRAVLAACEGAVGGPVEIEFAATLDPDHGAPARFGFLQVRPLAALDDGAAVGEDELTGPGVLVGCERALGSGRHDGLADVVYLRPEAFSAAATPAIARELEAINESLVRERRPYLLIGFGRWGTSDPSGGVPVVWGEISGARAIVEATVPAMRTEVSQGSHFFHNLTSLGVMYLSLSPEEADRIDWSWLAAQPAVRETTLVRHVRPARPLTVLVDGRAGRGVVRHD